MPDSRSSWPELSEAADGPTIRTLHLFSQVLGKVPTALLPWRNHGWHLTLHLGPRGLATEILHGSGTPFTLALDLVGREFVLEDESGRRAFGLPGLTVADFFEGVMTAMREAGHPVAIHAVPNEVDPATPFADDHAPRSCDADSAARLLGALLSADRVLRLFRSRFLGKVSPVHFFWGSFDLAVTRFSGRPAPPHPGGIPNLPDTVTREAYSHEVSSAGFWPGGAGMAGGPFFYAYAYPTPAGFSAAAVPPPARFDEPLGEFVLDYADLRAAPDPDGLLLDFLEATYRAAADLAGWDRETLECGTGHPGVPRPV